MPDITEVKAFYSRKVQLEQFEPVQHSVELHAELGGDEDIDEAYDELAERAEDMVERALAGRVTRKKLADAEGEDE